MLGKQKKNSVKGWQWWCIFHQTLPSGHDKLAVFLPPPPHRAASCTVNVVCGEKGKTNKKEQLSSVLWKWITNKVLKQHYLAVSFSFFQVCLFRWSRPAARASVKFHDPRRRRQRRRRCRLQTTGFLCAFVTRATEMVLSLSGHTRTYLQMFTLICLGNLSLLHIEECEPWICNLS